MVAPIKRADENLSNAFLADVSVIYDPSRREHEENIFAIKVLESDFLSWYTTLWVRTIT